ncbi:MAG: Nif3-like dinuclear metal center hexameric protein [Blautia sp.]|nr:Nif3-like dinuclear metal center hexameric protein [Blautia sp.]MDY3998725.1 Nif3-like dinuclear metal center hexameric protein [Blautia sp.]
MKVNEMFRWLEENYPPSSAEDWDNVGFLVGDDTKEVRHVFLALDLTAAALEEAAAAGADMIITHHPMIFGGMKRINNHDFLGRKVLSLIQHGIQYYAMHTNYDILGMAELSADYLQLQDTTVLSVTEERNGKYEGIGRVGRLPRRMTLRECAEFVKTAFDIHDVKVYGDLGTEVELAAVCTGSGKSLMKEVLASGAQVYVTGDIDHHTGLDAVDQGVCLIDAGHYGTEYIFMDAMKKRIHDAFPELQISCAKVQEPYTLIV